MTYLKSAFRRKQKGNRGNRKEMEIKKYVISRKFHRK